VTEQVDGTRPRRLWLLWTALGVVVVLIACALPATAVLLLANRRPAATPTDRGPAPSPGPDDPVTVTGRWLGERIDEQLDRQATALLGGDRAAFLAIADPVAHPDLKRQFAALRALRVTVWRPVASGAPVPVAGRPDEWRLLVNYQHCFVVPGCAPSPVLVGTRWRAVGDRPKLLAVEPSRSEQTGTRPWEVSDLVVAVGARTLVATVPALRAQLPRLLAEAESAAKTADRYAVDGSPPDRYRIFYAGRSEWRSWYGGGRPEWTGGYAVTVGAGHHEVVLNSDELPATGLDDLLRHELTHAASLPDRGYPGDRTWWLVEGVAEFAGAGGLPADRYEGLDDVRQLLGGDWNRRLDQVAPAEGASAVRVGGSYGVSYLAVRRLVERFGEERMLAFFRAVVHERKPPEEASRDAFGEEWGVLHDDCVAYLRALAG